MKHLILLFVVCAFILPETSEARRRSKGGGVAVFVAPFAGYGIGDLEVQNGADADSSGLGYGAQLGVEFSRTFQLGLDVSMGKGELEYDIANTTQDIESLDLGLMLGFNFHPKISIYGTYVLSSEVEFDGTPISEIEGDGYNVGVAFRAHRHVKLEFPKKQVHFS